MKKFTHAWIAFKAVERINAAALNKTQTESAKLLADLFYSYRDGVITGAWYPDLVFKDNATSHILKITPADAPAAPGQFPALTKGSLLYKHAPESPMYGKAFTVNPNTNLPERCEALSHSVVDHLRIQKNEDKGSPLTPTGNLVALSLFILSHYIADAHMPLHCDARNHENASFDLHAAIEQMWETEVALYYDIDISGRRFRYNSDGMPLFRASLPPDRPKFADSILNAVNAELQARPFSVDYGDETVLHDVLDYMRAVCGCSYLMAYTYLPAGYDYKLIDPVTLDLHNPASQISFRDMSVAVLADAVDAVARVWLRDVVRFAKPPAKSEP